MKFAAISRQFETICKTMGNGLNLRRWMSQLGQFGQNARRWVMMRAHTRTKLDSLGNER